MEVEVISKETIKPSSPTPDNLRHQQLSFLDQIQLPVYMPLILFYPKVEARRVKGNLYIDCNNEGVHYMEAEAKCKLSEFLENPNPAELNKFLPYELDHPNELPIAVQGLIGFAATQPKEDPDKIYAMVHAVNLRTRMDPPILDDYFGNFSRIAFSVPSRDTEDRFYGIIKPMRDAIKKVDVEFVKNLQ
ncbi:hypothetical protein SO802_011997 [Lithocarpus litseifolius]|uniref:Uncharacterized protein n=1 Tax=Lithocarpus litseifolius TaxID=425828 RepID=A0AAW2D289_9ROSI